MPTSQERLCTAFEGTRCIASGTRDEVTKAVIDGGERASVLIFDDLSGEVIDVDFRGVLPIDTPASPEVEAPRRVGRPN